MDRRYGEKYENKLVRQRRMDALVQGKTNETCGGKRPRSFDEEADKDQLDLLTEKLVVAIRGPPPAPTEGVTSSTVVPFAAALSETRPASRVSAAPAVGAIPVVTPAAADQAQTAARSQPPAADAAAATGPPPLPDQSTMMTLMWEFFLQQKAAAAATTPVAVPAPPLGRKGPTKSRETSRAPSSRVSPAPFATIMAAKFAAATAAAAGNAAADDDG